MCQSISKNLKYVKVKLRPGAGSLLTLKITSSALLLEIALRGCSCSLTSWTENLYFTDVWLQLLNTHRFGRHFTLFVMVLLTWLLSAVQAFAKRKSKLSTVWRRQIALWYQLMLVIFHTSGGQKQRNARNYFKHIN